MIERCRTDEQPGRNVLQLAPNLARQSQHTQALIAHGRPCLVRVALLRENAADSTLRRDEVLK
jgi:hypothetical protein